MLGTMIKALGEKALYAAGAALGSKVAVGHLMRRTAASQIMSEWHTARGIHGISSSRFGDVYNFVTHRYNVPMPGSERMSTDYIMSSEQLDSLFQTIATALIARGDVQFYRP